MSEVISRDDEPWWSYKPGDSQAIASRSVLRYSFSGMQSWVDWKSYWTLRENCWLQQNFTYAEDRRSDFSKTSFRLHGVVSREMPITVTQLKNIGTYCLITLTVLLPYAFHQFHLPYSFLKNIIDIRLVNKFTVTFLSTFAKLGKANINFVTPVRPSVSSSFREEQLCSHWTDFRKILYFMGFLKSVKKKFKFS
jgi:hypothetical protein